MAEGYSKTFTGSLRDEDGNVRWFINGALSRENDLPAVEYANGIRAWYVENPKRGGFGQSSAVAHREGGPALTRPDGTQLYYRLGKLDRRDGPAVVLADGTQKWFEDDKCIKVVLPSGQVIEY